MRWGKAEWGQNPPRAGGDAKPRKVLCYAGGGQKGMRVEMLMGKPTHLGWGKDVDKGAVPLEGMGGRW